MKSFTPNLQAMKERLEKNKQKNTRKEKISVYDNPILKVEGPGKYNFRAVYYPHSEDPASDPFPVRHYHFGIPGGVVYCPQMNRGEKCHLCDFVWDRMKEFKGQKEKVREWADKLPKARLWVPGKVRNYKVDGTLVEREKEGVRFFSCGTALDKMSTNHSDMMGWFFEEPTQNWLSEDKGPYGGFDMILEYEEYDEKKKKTKFGANGFGLKGVDLARLSTPFGEKGEFEEFLALVPNIDDNDIDVLKAYTAKTTEDTEVALEKWQEKLEKRSGSRSEEADTSADEDESDDDDSSDEVEDDGSNKSEILKRLAKYNIKK